jgi:hypothetical protein
VREHDQRHRPVAQHGLEALRLQIALEHAQGQATLVGEPFEHVAVGREVVAIGDHRALGREPVGVERRRAELEQIDGRGVGHHDLAGPGAEHALGERVADTRGGVDPLLPAGHEPVAPLVHDGEHALARGERQPPERVAVEVDRI